MLSELLDHPVYEQLPDGIQQRHLHHVTAEVLEIEHEVHDSEQATRNQAQAQADQEGCTVDLAVHLDC